LKCNLGAVQLHKTVKSISQKQRTTQYKYNSQLFPEKHEMKIIH